MNAINPLTKLVCAVACALPMIAMAQSSPAPTNPNGPTRNGPAVAPAQGTGSATMPPSEMERNPATDNSQAMKYPDTTSTTDSTDTSSMKKPMRKSKMHKRSMDKSGETSPVGDEPTYPANTKDGRPTSDSSSTMSK